MYQCVLGGGGSIFYNPKHDYSKDYLTFIPKTEGQFSINNNGSGTTSNTISYSIGDGDWTNIAYGVQTPTVQAGQKIRFKGTPDTSYTGNQKSIGTFQCTTSFDAEGNAMSMTHGDNYQSATAMQSVFELASLFQNSSIISAENLVLPPTTLTDNCYNCMFNGCTGLTTAPSVLPATTLADGCYLSMFQGCTSLTSAPQLPATTLDVRCYSAMFSGCTSLTTAPELPATSLANFCYTGMFWGCTSLTTGPALPATTLARNCYNGMFYQCTSMTIAPELPAATLTNNCYQVMFAGCTSLNSITCLATDITANKCTNSWVEGVAASGTFTKAASMSDWTSKTGNDGIPTGWTVENKQ